MKCYQATGRYTAIVAQDLQPLWRDVVRAQPRLATPPSEPTFALVSLLAEAGDGNDPADHIATYFRKLCHVSRDSLRLRSNGGATFWAMMFLHSDVAGIDPPGIVPPSYEGSEFDWFSGDMILLFSPYIGSVECTMVDHALTERPTIEGMLTVGDGENRVFDWDAYRDLAHECLDIVINQARHHIENQRPPRRPSTRRTQEDDLNKLFAHFFKKASAPDDEATRKRLRNLAKLLRIDFPIRQ